MTQLLMPKATASWLIEHTSLTFEQIAHFCGLHLLEVQKIADDEPESSQKGLDPVAAGQLNLDDIHSCEKDKTKHLTMLRNKFEYLDDQKKSKKYTPLAKRQDRPDAIFWVLKNCPDIDEKRIADFLNSTKATVLSIKNKTHWNIKNLKPKNPVSLGLCSERELEKFISLYQVKES